MPEDLLPVGRVTGAWGVRGWVRIAPFNDPRSSLLLQLSLWWLRAADTRAVEVEAAKPHGAAEIVAKLAGVDDREAALALDGTEVLLSREQFPEPQAGEVYWADLIGCRVLGPDGESLGIVVAIDDQPAHPVMRLSDEQAGGGDSAESGVGNRVAAIERLVPFVPDLILSIDLAARVIVVDWRQDY